jgi:hypothetical protein
MKQPVKSYFIQDFFGGVLIIVFPTVDDGQRPLVCIGIASAATITFRSVG